MGLVPILKSRYGTFLYALREVDYYSSPYSKMNKNSYILDSPSQSIITSLSFNNSNLLLCSTFDGKVTIYDTSLTGLANGDGNPLSQIDLHLGILSCCWLDDDNVICGLVNGGLYLVDFTDIQTPIVKDLEEDMIASEFGISCICVIDRYTVIVGSWDKSIRVIDLKRLEECVKVECNAKVFSMDYSHINKTLVCATSNREVKIFQLVSTNRLDLIDTRENGFKYQTKIIRCIPDGSGYVQGSIEGKVSVDYFDPRLSDQGYAFKCHREPETREVNTELVNPVNSLAFHSKYMTLFTGGSDGQVFIWDFKVKKRITKYAKIDPISSVVGIAFDGSQNAIAVGYSDDSFKNMTHIGDVEHSSPSVDSKIVVKLLSEREGQLKSSTVN